MALLSTNPSSDRVLRSPQSATSALVFLLALACSASAQQPALAPGAIVERVVTGADATQSYALYLPSNYTPQKKWPVIFGFDPGARGKVPVALFRDAAEKYGYIVAASNNS